MSRRGVGMPSTRSNETAGRSFRGGVLRFFFHLYDDIVSIDEEGKEFPSLQAAREWAFSVARQMACAEVLEGHLHLKHRIEVADQSGQVLATVRFQDAVKVES